MRTNKPLVMGIMGIRSGSKGVSDKNIRPLAGRPLAGWVLSEACKSEYLNRTIVSTDSELYADVARTFGAEVPCLRPSGLAQDDSPEIEYVRHMLDWLSENEGYVPDIVVRLMATVPLQLAADIDALVKILNEDPEADSAVAVSEARQHPIKALKIHSDGAKGESLAPYFFGGGRDVTPGPRQSYEPAFFRANIIAFRTRTIESTGSLTGDLVRPYRIPQERAIDIDNEVDFMVAEYLMNLYARG